MQSQVEKVGKQMPVALLTATLRRLYRAAKKEFQILVGNSTFEMKSWHMTSKNKALRGFEQITSWPNGTDVAHGTRRTDGTGPTWRNKGACKRLCNEHLPYIAH